MKDLFIMAAMLAALIGVAVGVDYTIENVRCHSYATNTSKEVKYSYIGGCFVRTEKGWYHRDQLREGQ